jgi:hypothetical protein
MLPVDMAYGTEYKDAKVLGMGGWPMIATAISYSSGIKSTRAGKGGIDVTRLSLCTHTHTQSDASSLISDFSPLPWLGRHRRVACCMALCTFSGSSTAHAKGRAREQGSEPMRYWRTACMYYTTYPTPSCEPRKLYVS